MHRILNKPAKIEIETILKENLEYNLDGHMPNHPEVILKDVGTLEGITSQMDKQIARTDLEPQYRDAMILYVYSAKEEKLKAVPIALRYSAQVRFKLWDTIGECADKENVKALGLLMKMQHDLQDAY